MKIFTDKELLEELKRRIDERSQTNEELRLLNEQLLEVNQKLKESEALKSNFLSNARNEIINPVASILSLTRSISLSNKNDQTENRRLASIIYTEAFDLNFQMNNIFSSAEIEAGEAICEFIDMDLVNLINEEIKKFEPLANKKGLHIIINNHLGDNERMMKNDQAKIKIILDNLIVNAINWADKKGEIIVELSSLDTLRFISVSDPGPGINKDNQKIIFDRFKTIDPTVHTKNKGHGLGLSVVKAYTEMLEGEIVIESSEGKGSTFIIKIPAIPTLANASDQSQSSLFNDVELF